MKRRSVAVFSLLVACRGASPKAAEHSTVAVGKGTTAGHAPAAPVTPRRLDLFAEVNVCISGRLA